jgi:hypothetical protein
LRVDAAIISQTVVINEAGRVSQIVPVTRFGGQIRGAFPSLTAMVAQVGAHLTYRLIANDGAHNRISRLAIWRKPDGDGAGI